MSDVLVTVRCEIHRGRTGVLRDHPNGFRQYRTTNPGIYARNRKLIGLGPRGDTGGWNFFEPSDYEKEIESWCQECGGGARMFHGSRLLVAVQDRRKSIFV